MFNRYSHCHCPTHPKSEGTPRRPLAMHRRRCHRNRVCDRSLYNKPSQRERARERKREASDNTTHVKLKKTQKHEIFPSRNNLLAVRQNRLSPAEPETVHLASPTELRQKWRSSPPPALGYYVSLTITAIPRHGPSGVTGRSFQYIQIND